MPNALERWRNFSEAEVHDTLITRDDSFSKFVQKEILTARHKIVSFSSKNAVIPSVE
jgi:hypothetical protein